MIREPEYIAVNPVFSSEQERMNGMILNESNKKFIQQQLYFTVQSKLNLKPDPESYAKFVQEEAILEGMRSAYQFLLDSHEDTIRSINTDTSPQNS